MRFITLVPTITYIALFTSPSERKIAANTDENNRNTVKLNEIVP